MAERIAFSSQPLTLDTDASAFLTAGSITNSIQQMAVNELVLDWKRFGLWGSKIIAGYPMVGGTATAHKFNIRDPRDLDAAYRLNFVGGWTHSATGALPNGTTGYADTFIIPSSALSLNSTHVSYYSGTSGAVNNKCEIGTGNVVSAYIFLCFYYESAYYFDVNCNSDLTFTNPNAVTTGFLCANRTASNILKGYRNDSILKSSSLTSTTISNNSITLAAWNNNGGKASFSTKECRFATIGTGLTDTDVFNLYTSIQKFQGLLNRAIF